MNGRIDGPIVEITKPHSHLPNTSLKGVLQQRFDVEQRVLSSRDAPRRVIRDINSKVSEDVMTQLPTDKATTQFINRVKSKNEKYGKNASSRNDIVIPRSFRFTLSGNKFYLDDSADDDRIIVFATEDNLSIMSQNPDWLCDGTFDISPLLYTQLFTIHVIYRSNLLFWINIMLLFWL